MCDTRVPTDKYWQTKHEYRNDFLRGYEGYGGDFDYFNAAVDASRDVCRGRERRRPGPSPQGRGERTRKRE